MLAALKLAGGLAGGIFRAVPLWAWALLALLAWGGVQRHQTQKLERELAAEQKRQADARGDVIRDALVDQVRQRNEERRIADEATERARASRADADRARDALQRVRDRSAGAAAPAATGAAGAASEVGQATGTPAGVLADLLGRCGERVRILARVADERRDAGLECERRFDALTVAP